MNKKEFIKNFIKENRLCGGDAEYITLHTERFYATYNKIKRLMKENSRVLSVGAWKSPVETYLVKEFGAEIIAIDFPEAIEHNREFYRRNNITAISVDLSKENLELDIDPVDIVLSLEVVEHIPKPPSEHFIKLSRYLKSGGYMVITTPNLASIRHIIKLLLNKAIFAAPEETFAPVGFDNQAIHRREYVEAEILEAMERTSFFYESTDYMWYWRPHRIREWLMFGFEIVVPRFRPAMTIIGQRK